MRRASISMTHVGVLVVVFGLGKIHAAAIGDYDLTQSSRLAWTVAYAGLLSGCAYAVGLPDLSASRRGWVLALWATGTAATLCSLVQLATGQALLPRYVVLGSALVLAPWFTTCAALAEGGRVRREGRDLVLAVVSDEEAARLIAELAVGAERPARVVCTMSCDEAAHGGTGLALAASKERATVIVLDRAAQADEHIVSQAAALHEAGTRIRTLTLFYDEWLGKLPLTELERVALMFDIGELHRARYGRLKRALDVVVALPGLVLLGCVIPVVALGNTIANRGPLLYRQPRVGRGGVVFTILKLRSIRPGASGGEWLDPSDPRITPFGRWLRRSHVDELPQVVNILTGDLSIVGPRPEQPGYVEELRQKVPFYDLRHRVRPGLTGWAQVKYEYADDHVGAMEKLQYEFYYLRHQSLGLDLRIIGRTLRSVARLSGR